MSQLPAELSHPQHPAQDQQTVTHTTMSLQQAPDTSCTLSEEEEEAVAAQQQALQEQESYFSTASNFPRQRPVQEILSSVQGTYDFLQESHVDLDCECLFDGNMSISETASWQGLSPLYIYIYLSIICLRWTYLPYHTHLSVYMWFCLLHQSVINAIKLIPRVMMRPMLWQSSECSFKTGLSSDSNVSFKYSSTHCPVQKLSNYIHVTLPDLHNVLFIL